MPPTDTLSYDLVERLVQTLEILRQGPATARQISEMLAPDSVPATESEVRRTLRDMRALERLGFQIEERGKPIRFTLRGGTTPSFDDEEVQTLALIRETFSEGYPHSDAVQRLLERMTAALSDHQRRIYTRRPTLRLPLRTAVDYRPYDHLIRWLEDRITKRQQIAFDYRPLSTSSIVRYDRLDPYEIEYFHNHFYLLAYNHQTGYEQEFRIDRIVQHDRSPEPTFSPVQHKRRRKPVEFIYRLPARFVEHGVSARFTILDHWIEDEWAYIRAEGRSDFWIIRTLLAYAENAVIIEPAWLKQQYIETMRRMLAVNDEERNTP